MIQSIADDMGKFFHENWMILLSPLFVMIWLYALMRFVDSRIQEIEAEQGKGDDQ